MVRIGMRGVVRPRRLLTAFSSLVALATSGACGSRTTLLDELAEDERAGSAGVGGGGADGSGARGNDWDFQISGGVGGAYPGTTVGGSGPGGSSGVAGTGGGSSVSNHKACWLVCMDHDSVCMPSNDECIASCLLANEAALQCESSFFDYLICFDANLLPDAICSDTYLGCVGEGCADDAAAACEFELERYVTCAAG